MASMLKERQNKRQITLNTPAKILKIALLNEF